MIIKISGLLDGVHNFLFEEPVEKLDLSEPFQGNIKAEVKLNKSHHQIVLDSKLRAKAQFQCDRCGIDFDQMLEANFEVVYLFGSSPAASENLNLTYLPYDADKINISQDVRDYALLSVPMKKLCSEDCKGLCPKCGRNLNEGKCDCKFDEIDSRWQPLIELKNKLNNK
ncbi:MAG: DUF177 domain-containing protein [Ignavibacteriaceae bacterium]|nr:DUF177 domain-containing protein [Ignavibacteriaceae bacterium]